MDQAYIQAVEVQCKISGKAQTILVGGYHGNCFKTIDTGEVTLFRFQYNCTHCGTSHEIRLGC